MTENKGAVVRQLSAEDEQVFRDLAGAQQQYELYLQVSQTAAAVISVDDVVLPPSPDLPLTLTVWRSAE